ncbi:MAG: alpha/beta hydrolase [Sphingomonadaceae bacterium]|nr:alpha/beta hydrolase [Sphingomonadaceae bacterium]
MILRRLALAFALLAATPAAAQYQPLHGTVIPLYPNGAPGSEARRNEPETAQDYWIANVHNPSLTWFAPDPHHANGAAIIIFPGGAHRQLVWTTEALNFARTLNRMGITVFALKYRLAREPGSTYTIEGTAAGDARQAVRLVRANAAQYGIDPHRIGVMGFSAGGELVTLIADNPEPGPPRPDDRESARPDFQILIFPGPLGLPARAVAGAPPAFLAAGSRDECCATPTVQLYEQLRAAGVPAELHMFAEAGHAFNLDESNRLAIIHWPDRLADWLADGGWLDQHSNHESGR